MDSEEEFLIQWWEMRGRLIACLICLVVQYCVAQMYNHKKKITYNMSSTRERVREEVMYRITCTPSGRDIVRMSLRAFLGLYDMLERDGGLKPTRYSSVEEQVAKTLYILSHKTKNHVVKFWFRRSGETVSRHFHSVLGAIIELEDKFLIQPDGSRVPPEIQVKPKAALWRNTPLPNYKKMLALYGNDRANGDDGDTPSNMKKRRRLNPHEFVDSINEVDQLTPQNEATLENFSINMETPPLDDHSPEANSETSKRTKKSGTSKDRDPSQIPPIVEKIEFIANALSEGNKIFKDRYVPQISGEETLKMIVDAGCEEDKIYKIYCFLMNDVAKLRAVIQCPPLLRKQVIMEMVFDS